MASNAAKIIMEVIDLFLTRVPLKKTKLSKPKNAESTKTGF